MATVHIVEQGEHLAQIADKHGFMSWRPIWDHADNSALKELRKNPNVLYPGDKVVIPAMKVKAASVKTGQTHWFRVARPKLKLRIAVKDFDNQPAAGVDGTIEVAGVRKQLKSNARGMFELDVAASARAGKLTIPSLGVEVPLQIGHLDPMEENSGWEARLSNLGYDAKQGAPQAVASALQEFQCDHSLKVTGMLDAPTRQRLKELHGC